MTPLQEAVMKLTPLDIQQQQFTMRFRGFDVREVDLFLEQMANTFEQLHRENEALKEEILRLRRESQGLKKREETFKRAMIHSQKVLDNMRENAEKQAELIVAEAEIKGDKIVHRAQNRLNHLQEDITELRRQRVQIEVEINAIIEAHAKLLKISRESMQAADDKDDKVAILSNSST
jgi:cell division initiation protein